MEMTSDGRIGQTPPPPGITPNFDNPPDSGWMLNIVGISILSALATIFFLIRCYTRIFVFRSILISDVTCLLGYIFSSAYAYTFFIMSQYGMGHHSWDVTREDYTIMLKWLYIASLTYIPGAYFVKVTILLLIARVFAVEERLSKGIYIFIFVLLFIYTPIQTIKITVCTPIRAYWDPTISKIGCIPQRKLFLTDLTIAALADVIILILPIPVTWAMRLPLRQKLKIIFMLSAGSLATGVTIFRLIQVAVHLDPGDISGQFAILDLTTVMELTIGIVCACMPSAYRLYKHCKNRQSEKMRVANRPRTGQARRNLSPTMSWSSLRNTGTVNTTKTANHNVASIPDTHLAPQMMQAQSIQSLTATVPTNSPSRSDSLAQIHLSHINSQDGRVEGWLATKAEAKDKVDLEAVAGSSSCTTQPARRWSTIWDGSQSDK